MINPCLPNWLKMYCETFIIKSGCSCVGLRLSCVKAAKSDNRDFAYYVTTAILYISELIEEWLLLCFVETFTMCFICFYAVAVCPLQHYSSEDYATFLHNQIYFLS